MYSKLLIAYLCVVLSACGAIGALKAFIPSSQSGLSVDAQIGDKEQAVQVGGVKGAKNISAKGNAVVNLDTAMIESNVEEANEVTINNDPSPWLYLILILGWVLPTPMSMFRSLKGLYHKRKNKDGK